MSSVQLVELENGCQELAADLNHDGKINSIDALIIIQLNVELMEIEDLYNPGLVR
jgi:hypothetical protein